MKKIKNLLILALPLILFSFSVFLITAPKGQPEQGSDAPLSMYNTEQKYARISDLAAMLGEGEHSQSIDIPEDNWPNSSDLQDNKKPTVKATSATPINPNAHQAYSCRGTIYGYTSSKSGMQMSMPFQLIDKTFRESSNTTKQEMSSSGWLETVIYNDNYLNNTAANNGSSFNFNSTGIYYKKGTLSQWPSGSSTTASNCVDFTLWKDGTQIDYQRYSGDGSRTAYSGTLSEGNYVYRVHVSHFVWWTIGFNTTSYLTEYLFEYTFQIDNTAPAITLSGVTDGGFTNGNVTPTFNNTVTGVGGVGRNSANDVLTAMYSVNGTSGQATHPSTGNTYTWTSGQTFTAEGHYTLTLTDSAGNQTIRRFTIDKTAPTLTISVGNGGFSNTVVTATWETTINGIGYNRIHENDTLTVTYGSSTSTSFPTEASCTTAYTRASDISAAGNYRIVIKDRAGNQSSYTFTIDKSAPVLSLSGVTNGGITKSNVSATWGIDATSITSQRSNANDSLSVTYAVNTTNENFPTTANLTYTSGTSLTQEGNYLLWITDRAGNRTPYTFTIDKTAPILTLSGVANAGFTNGNVSASWSNIAAGVGANRTISSDTLTVTYSFSTTATFPTSATTVYTTVTQLSTAGNYFMTITDAAGNSTSYTFTIDKSDPVLSLSGVTNGGFTNGNVSATWGTEANSITSQRSNTNDTLTITYGRNSSASFPTVAQSTTAYTSGLLLTLEGNYRIVITDRAGNYTSYTFTIDKTAPVGNLRPATGNFASGNRTRQNVIFSWTTGIDGVGGQRINDNDTITGTFSHSVTGFPTQSQTTISTNGNTEYSTAGYYRIELRDRSDNVTVYTFHVDRTPPIFEVINAGMKVLSQDNLIYGEDIRITTAATNTITINGQPYTGSFLTEEASYALVVADDLGNTTSKTIIIIKTPPTANYNRLRSPLNKWYETENLSGVVWSYSTYDPAYAMADQRERAKLVQGTWTNNIWHYPSGALIAPADQALALALAGTPQTYFLYTAYDNPNNLYAYFSLATLNSAIEQYTRASIVTRYISMAGASPTIPAPGENILRETFFSRTAITFNLIANCNIFVNGVQQNYPFVLTAAGTHTILERDLAGNSVTYTVIIDPNPPIVRVTNLNGNLPSVLINGIVNRFTYGVVLRLDDVDDQAILIVGEGSNLVYYIGRTVDFRSAGVYQIRTFDAAGNSQSFTIEISLDLPEIIIDEVTVNDCVTAFTVSVRTNHTINKVTSYQFGRWNDSTQSFELLHSDSNATGITSTISETYNVSGRYQFIAMDNFGRYFEREYNFIKDAPKGNLFTSSGDHLQNGDITRFNVYFTWTVALTCSATINGGRYVDAAYERGTIISESGTFEIKLFSNTEAGLYNIYIFTIDKAAPTGTLLANGQPLANGGTTRHGVTFEWSASLGHTATLNGQPYANGSVITEEGEYTLILTSRAGVRTTYNFDIKTKPPAGTLYTTVGTIKNGDITRYDVYFNWTERDCTAVLNGAAYERNTRIFLEGSYSIVLTDAFGNVATFFFSIDKTPPVGRLFDKNGEIPNGHRTNNAVFLTWEKPGCIAVMNGIYLYESGTPITEDGVYEIVISDMAGNRNTYSFTIKTTPPPGRLFADGIEVPNNTHTRYDVYFNWSETGATATVNGAPYTRLSVIRNEGVYVFVLTDVFGNSATHTITIDKTPAVLFATSNGEQLRQNDVTRHTVYLYWDKEGSVCYVNGKLYEQGEELSEEGEYTVVLTDYVGNRTLFSFIIDKTNKIGFIMANGESIESGSFTRYNVYFTWSERNCTATVNGNNYERGNLITAEGDYTIILTDAAGNTTTYTFTIDKTPAAADMWAEQNDVASRIPGSTYSGNANIFFTWIKADCTATLNGNPYTQETRISAEGFYTFVLRDRAGNTTTLTFTIDKSAPVLRGYNVNNLELFDGAFTRYSVYITWNKSNCTATVNGATYYRNDLITETGHYVVLVTDAFGNVSRFEFTINKVLPSANVYDLEGNILNEYTLNTGFSIEWAALDCTATLNGEVYDMETVITEEGDYIFILENNVGSQFIVSIVIDKTPPVIQAATQGSKELANGATAIDYFFFTWTKQDCRATVNGNPYSRGTLLYEDRGYYIILTDAAGNVSEFIITLQRKRPMATIYTESGGELENHDSTKESFFVLAGENISITVNGAEYEMGGTLTAAGSYEIVLTNEHGVTNTYTITITEQREGGDSTSPFAGLFGGSTTGNVLLILFGVGLIGYFGVWPFIKNKIKNPFKAKLEK